MLQNFIYNLFFGESLEKSFQRIDRSVDGILQKAHEIFDYNKDSSVIFDNMLKLVALSKGSYHADWYGDVPERNWQAKRFLFDQTEKEIYMYVDEFPASQDLGKHLAPRLGLNTIVPHIICSQVPDEKSDFYRDVLVAIDEIGRGSISIATPESRAIMAEALPDGKAEHMFIADKRHFIIDLTNDGTSIFASLGTPLPKKGDLPIVTMFQEAARVSELIIGKPPKTRKSFWSFAQK